MQFARLKKTVAMLIAFLGIKDIPLNAEKTEVSFSEDQEKLLKGKLGDDLLAELKQVFNKELKAAQDDNLELKAINDEIKALLQEEVQEDEEEENPKEVNANGVEGVQELKALMKKKNDLIQQLLKEDVADVSLVKNLNTSKMTHSPTHLFAINEQYNAFENRSWNVRARDLSARTSDFNEKTDIPLLQDDIEHFIRKNPSVLNSLFWDYMGLPSEWSRQSGIIDRVANGTISPAEITQARAGGWAPKNKFKIENEEGRVYPKKIDITFKGHELQRIETTWINFLNANDGSQPWKMTFVGFLLSELMKQQVLDSRIAQINGIFAQQPDDVAGYNVNSQNGLRYLWWLYRDVKKKYQAVELGAPTPDNIVDYIEALIMSIPEQKREMPGYEIELSYTVLKWYKEKAGLEYQLKYNDDLGKKEYSLNHPIDRPNYKFQPLIDMTNTLFIGITMSKNVEILDYKTNEKGQYTLTHDKRDTHIFLDFREGIRFIHVGTTLEPGDPETFKIQSLYSNTMPIFPSEIAVPLYDKGTSIIEFKEYNGYNHFRIVQDNFNSDITQIKGFETGTVVRITGNTSLLTNKAVKHDATKIALTGNTDFPLNNGGTLTLVVNASGVLVELSRTSAPAAAPSTDVVYTTAVIDSKLGNVFRAGATANLTVNSILNGYEGKTIRIYGTDAASTDITVADSATIEVAGTSVTLGTAAHYVDLVFANGKFRQYGILNS